MVKRTSKARGSAVHEGDKPDYQHYVYYCKTVGGGLRIFKARRKGSARRSDTGKIHHSKTRVYQHRNRDELESSGW
jgi:hypothetical protein